jgi:GGDEF domain-containing protein
VALDIGRTLYDIDFSGLVGKTDFKMTLSIGISVYPTQADNSQELVRLAHDRMITARSKGGNRIIATQ